MLKRLAPGDVVTVTRIDRLARSTLDLFSIVRRIVDAKAQFRSLAEPWADTGTRAGRLILAVLGGLADGFGLVGGKTALGSDAASPKGTKLRMLSTESDNRVLCRRRYFVDSSRMLFGHCKSVADFTSCAPAPISPK
jgi:hypothetical protein